ncbi:MAG: PCMD domain-containing protein, partial [Dysgonomonas sp.]
IKDETLYMEADLIDFRFADSIYVSTSVQGDSLVYVVVKGNTDLTRLTPLSTTISPNATIEPSIDSAQNFKKDVVYKITSEDGSRVTNYKVRVIYPPSTLKFDFEDWVPTSAWKYPSYQDPNYPMWDLANMGAAFLYGSNKDYIYPTRDTTDAYSGNKAALLETLKGSDKIVFGMKAYILPGNLFTGKFGLGLSLIKFGSIINIEETGKPIEMSGYYKYKPGDVFSIDGKPIEGQRTDKCDIYAILYRVTKGKVGESESLNGTNIKSDDDRVIARAVVSDEDKTPTDIYKPFNAKFKYVKSVDPEMYDYKIAIIFSSSEDGDRFEGAIGSKLTIDEVEVKLDDYRKQ